MARLIREIAADFCPAGIRFYKEALKAIQEMAEAYLAQLFTNTNLCAIHAGRITITKKDMKLVRRLRGDDI